MKNKDRFTRLEDEAFKLLQKLAKKQQRTLKTVASNAIKDYHYQETGED